MTDPDVLSLASNLTSKAGKLAYRRTLTPEETKHGDIARVRADFDKAEVAVAAAGATSLAQSSAHLISAANAHMSLHSLSGVAGMASPDALALATAMEQGSVSGFALGEAQVLEWSSRNSLYVDTQTENYRARKAAFAAALAGFALLGARGVLDKMTHTVRLMASRRMALGGSGLTAEDVAAIDSAAVRFLTPEAASIGRRAMTYGRTSELALLAARAIRKRNEGIVLEALIRSEVLDDNTCGTCEARDGDMYSDIYPDSVGSLEEGLDAVPDPDCEGTLGGNVCRGIMVPVV